MPMLRRDGVSIRHMPGVSRSMCLDEPTILALVGGELDAHAVQRAERHLAACGECREFVATVARSQLSAAQGDETSRSSADLQPGQLLADKYRLERKLGQGGMGTVFAARHVELGHLVAIKVLH